MIPILLGLSTVFGLQLMILGLTDSKKSRTYLIEKNIGASEGFKEAGLQVIFSSLRHLVTGDAFNPWGTDEKLARVLKCSGDTRTLLQFRRSQMIGLLSFQISIVLWACLRKFSNQNVSAVFVLSALLCSIPLSGWVVYELQQSRVKKREQIIELQLASMLDLLAFSVSAGEPIILAIGRVSKLCNGVLAEVLGEIPRQLLQGATISSALLNAAELTSSTSFSRSIRAIQIALDRGTPIAGVLRAQAYEARSGNQQNLLNLAGKKEAAMMVPVVFFILPMIVFIALYPGLSALQLA